MVWKLQQLGIKALYITIAPMIPNRIGHLNLQNLINTFGIDHIMITPNPKETAWKAKKSFLEQGDCFKPWVDNVHNLVPKIAKHFDLNIVIYGENGEAFYGGKGKNFDYYSGCPGILKIHLSDWVEWNTQFNIQTALEHGFQGSYEPKVGTFGRKYQSIDDDIDDLYLWFLYPKFGFGVETKFASPDIREGNLEREQAQEQATQWDGVFPWKTYKRIMEYLMITPEQLIATIRKFAHYHLDRCEAVCRTIEEKEAHYYTI